MASVIELIFYVSVAFAAFMLWRLATAWIQGGSQDVLLVDAEVGELKELAAEKSRAIHDLKELEFDHQIGHLSLTDYESLRATLENKTIRIMKRLDALRGDIDYDAVIDRELDRRLGDLDADVTAPKKVSGGEGNKKSKSKPGLARTSETQPCRACGHAMALGAVFCSECGARVAAACSKCGATMDEDARFCAKCGTPVGSAHDGAEAGEVLT